MKKRRWSDEELIAAVAKSVTWGQVARAVGLKTDGGNSARLIRVRVVELGLDTSHFQGRSWSKGQGSGRDPQKAREANRRWYEKNKQVYFDRNQLRFQENAKKLRAAKDRPCMDCGGRFPPFVMDFDHRDGVTKIGNVARLLRSWPWDRLQTEIDKCDLVCSNCHRIRTARRGGWAGQSHHMASST
jgi:hypothetical protein